LGQLQNQEPQARIAEELTEQSQATESESEYESNPKLFEDEDTKHWLSGSNGQTKLAIPINIKEPGRPKTPDLTNFLGFIGVASGVTMEILNRAETTCDCYARASVPKDASQSHASGGLLA